MHTSVCDLASIASCGGRTPLREGRSDLAELVNRRARTNPVVAIARHLNHLPILVLDLGGDGHDLVLEITRFLRLLGTLERLGSELVHVVPCDAKIAADVLGGPAHGLHAVHALLAVLGDLLVKRLFGCIAADRHGLGPYGNADLNVASSNGVGHIGDGFQTGGAEAVDGHGGGGIGKAGGEGGGAEPGGGFSIRHLVYVSRGK